MLSIHPRPPNEKQLPRPPPRQLPEELRRIVAPACWWLGVPDCSQRARRRERCVAGGCEPSTCEERAADFHRSRTPPARDGRNRRQHGASPCSAAPWSAYRVLRQAGRRRSPARALSALCPGRPPPLRLQRGSSCRDPGSRPLACGAVAAAAASGAQSEVMRPWDRLGPPAWAGRCLLPRWRPRDAATEASAEARALGRSPSWAGSAPSNTPTNRKGS